MEIFLTTLVVLLFFGIVIFLMLLAGTFDSFCLVFWINKNFKMVQYQYYDRQYRSFYFSIKGKDESVIAEIELDKSFDLLVKDFISKKRYSSFDMAPCFITKKILFKKLMSLIPKEDFDEFNITKSFKNRLR